MAYLQVCSWYCSLCHPSNSCRRCSDYVWEGICILARLGFSSSHTYYQSADFFALPVEKKACTDYVPLHNPPVDHSLGQACMGWSTRQPWLCSNWAWARNTMRRPGRDCCPSCQCTWLQRNYGDWSRLGCGLEESLASGNRCPAVQAYYVRFLPSKCCGYLVCGSHKRLLDLSWSPCSCHALHRPWTRPWRGLLRSKYRRTMPQSTAFILSPHPEGPVRGSGSGSCRSSYWYSVVHFPFQESITEKKIQIMAL